MTTLSLLPIDVGFDPRATRTPVVVPDFSPIYLKVPPSSRKHETQPRTIGPLTRRQAIAALRSRGYLVAGE